MNYQEIIDTIEVGDYVEVKGDPDIEDGVYPVIGLDDKEDYPSMLVCVLVDTITHRTWWLYLSSIVRKVSPTERQQELSTTEAQDSQNENDSSQSGSGIVVGSAWIFTSEYDEDGFSKGKIYRLSETDEEGYFGVVNDWEETIWFSDNGISTHFKPVEQSTGQSTDTLKEQPASEEVSGGVGVYDNILRALQYDPKDVAFTSESFPSDKLTKHYNFFYTLTEDDVEAGSLKLDPYFVSQQWKLGKKDDTGVLFHCLKTLARFGDKNDVDREIKALNAQVKRLAELHNVKL